jgi:hypothetical protein
MNGEGKRRERKGEEKTAEERRVLCLPSYSTPWLGIMTGASEICLSYWGEKTHMS